MQTKKILVLTDEEILQEIERYYRTADLHKHFLVVQLAACMYDDDMIEEDVCELMEAFHSDLEAERQPDLSVLDSVQADAIFLFLELGSNLSDGSHDCVYSENDKKIYDRTLPTMEQSYPELEPVEAER